MKRKAVRAAVLLQLLILSSSRVLAGTDLTCVAGHRNFVRAGEWTPVTITARTDGEAVSGRLVVEVLDPLLLIGRYEKPARVSAVKSPHTIYIALPRTLEAKLRVRFEAHGRKLAETEISLGKQVTGGTIILLNLTKPRALESLEGRFMGIRHLTGGIALANDDSPLWATDCEGGG